ncbi:acyltransferase domain-containing protein [Nocardia terpenica]|uniref:type I polyketide synthase n=1 Tax=Nocardia terpenica TaxID=455432 RepID=UPI001892F5DB|nr:type I polyketide synthase [Nocardia terpenica]MBF6063666.1 acyltransferase domain-containing protein [Nocardia terpenica]MBF6107042.1 acyltransferase domain-containing protein [Nocardia terpenica]MBF6114215.1 acyltransferase domain-containing protein [Nocardia terpenica]MBF6121698.1 acyltransferase domain-containing protein [Nocardia terpenica]MBF6154113.1 acyltransferase domain-containing protein [Nocardia terpenica]
MSTEVARHSADEISSFIVATLGELLDTVPEEIALTEPFASFGLTSALAVILVGRVSTWLGRTLPPDLPWEFPTVQEMAEGLAGGPHADAADAAEPVAQRPRGAQEPIAVIGIGCAVGDRRGPEQLWETLWQGTELVGEMPEHRRGGAQPRPRFGSFLPDPYAFDAKYFGISAEEAAYMDPQHRLLAETVADALADAGLPAERLAGTPTGTFVGISAGENARSLGEGTSIAAVTGNAGSIAANRLSYLYDLRGPSISVDTACSSSLVAVHLALRSLNDGDCELALVGGVNLTLEPSVTDSLAEAGMLAPDGRCKTFDERADGYVRGEGCAAVVLKPLAQAERDGDRVYAVLLGSAVNQDGRTNGLTAPNYRSQVEVLRRAYRRAGVRPGDVQYVESHGTGTALGDAVEARALGTVLGEDRGGDRALVGSVKTVVGHLEAAAGLMGLVKTALALHHGQVPGNLNFERPSSHIAFDDLPFTVAAENTAWPDRTGPALAGVSSFGFGGTNAHAVLTAATPVPAAAVPASAEKPRLFGISGRSEQAALAQVDDWLALLDGANPPDLAALSHASTARGSHHPYRVAVVATRPEDLRQRLAAVSGGSLPLGAAAGRVPRGGAGRIGFLFSGQGNQWLGMGRTLIRRQPVFRDALRAVDRELRPLLGWSPFAIIDRGRDAEALADTATAQPLIFALQIALTELWRSWGVVPGAVAGHSVGEVAAAHVAGVLDLPTAARIIAARAATTATLRGNGSMAVVNLPADELEPVLPHHVWIAGHNAPRWTLVSGVADGVEALVARLEADGVLTRRLPGEYAFHSPLMRECLDRFAAEMPAVAAGEARIPFYSTVTGDRVDGAALGADYWPDQVLRPVAFAEATGAMVDAGVATFVELGPHPVLGGMVKSVLRHRDRSGIAVPSLARDLDDLEVLLSSVAELHVRGHEIDWTALDSGHKPVVRLPLYPFERTSYRLVAGEPRIEQAAVAQRHTGLFDDDADFVAPRTEYEQFVAEMWAELLGLERIGVFENFFRIGGHSLLATRFVRRVRELFDIEFPLRLVFEEPTVARVATALEELLVEQADALLENEHELTS